MTLGARAYTQPRQIPYYTGPVRTVYRPIYGYGPIYGYTGCIPYVSPTRCTGPYTGLFPLYTGLYPYSAYTGMGPYTVYVHIPVYTMD